MNEKLVISTNEEDIRLTSQQGDFIKALIFRYHQSSQATYAAEIGMDKAMLSRYLTGDMKITPAALERILSNLTYEDEGYIYRFGAKWRTIIEILPTKIGPVVRPVDSTDTEETLLLGDSGSSILPDTQNKD